MSRGLVTANQAEVDATHLHEVTLLNLQFDTPIYVHSGIGNIVFDGNTYLGVGDFGATSGSRESENLGPLSKTYTLSGVDSTLIAEALDSGRYRDVVTEYEGYRQDDGTLVADPWVVYKSKYDSAAISLGGDNSVTITVQHDLADLNEISGRKFSDEDQQAEYPGDLGLENVVDSEFLNLLWGGRPVEFNTNPGGNRIGPRFGGLRIL